jgi:hypothetical protein
MIKEEKVLVNINIRNITSFKNKGYNVSLSDKSYYISVNDLNEGSTIKITAICDICSSENVITYNKYLVNINRNNKGYYSCFKCKNIEREKTCMSKYGVSSYSKTDEFRKSESEKWKGIQKGGDKYKKTMIDKYGVDCYFKLDVIKNYNKKWMSSSEFVEKSKVSMLKKYGVDHYSKTKEFKKRIIDNKYIILEKMKKTFYDKYGVDFYSKTDEFKSILKSKKEEIIKSIKETCLKRYGVDNVSKVVSVKNTSRITKLERGLIIPDELLNEWILYKKDVKNITRSFKKELFEKWNGCDYYDNEFIMGNFSYSHTHRFYPTIDHKISVYYGFVNNIPPEEISDISNLCITKRFINSKKRDLIESEFRISF